MTVSSSSIMDFQSTNVVNVNGRHSGKMTLVDNIDNSQRREIEQCIPLFRKALDKITVNNNGSLKGVVDPKRNGCVITLCKILDNILLERKYNPKTRSIKLSNKLFRERVGSIPGGVDILLACKFTYTTIQSKSNDAKKNLNGNAPANAIKLTKDKENRSLIVAARRYMHEYGNRAMMLKPGKHRNELPPYVIQDDVSRDVLQIIRQNVDAVIAEGSHNCIENLNTMNGSEDGSYSFDEHSISYSQSQASFSQASFSTLETSPSMRHYDCNPPSPVTICTVSEVDAPDDVSLSSAFTMESGISISDRNKSTIESEPQLHQLPSPDSVVSPEIIGSNSEKLTDKLKSLSQASIATSSDSSVAAREKEDSKSQISEISKTNEQGAETFYELNQSLEVRLDRMGAKIETQSDENELDIIATKNADDQSIGASDCLSRSEALSLLTDKDRESLDEISSVDISGKSEGEKILSIAMGREIPNSYKGSLFMKLNKLTTKGKAQNIDTPKDQKSISSMISHSVIRIQNSDGVSVQPRVSPYKERWKSSIQSASTKVASNIVGTIKIGGSIEGQNRTIIEIGLNLFFAVFVVTYNDGDTFLTSRQLIKNSNGSPSMDENGPCIPIEIVYKLWTTLLRGERTFNSVSGREIYMQFVKIAKNQDAYIDDDFLMSTLSENDRCACKYIAFTLQSSGLLKTEQLALGMEHMGVTEKNANFRIGIVISKSACIDFGVEIARDRLDIKYESTPQMKGQYHTSKVKKLQKRCHTILSRSLKENIDIECKAGLFIDRQASIDVLSTWYILQWLPCHMLSADIDEEAVPLLHDMRYMKFRLETNGLYHTTVQYVHECRMMRSKLQDKGETMTTDTLHSCDDYSSRAAKAIYDGILSFLNETRKEVARTYGQRPSDDLCNDLAEALHHIGLAIGEIGRPREEIDVLNEALRFKIASTTLAKDSIAETQVHLASCYHQVGDPIKAMVSYNEALILHENASGKHHVALTRILYQMGVIACEQCDYENAKSNFMRALSISKRRNATDQCKKDIAKIYSWLGNIQRERGHRPSALDFFEKSLKAMESSVGRDHLDTAEIMQNIGIIHDDNGDSEKSIKAFYECLRVRRKLLDEEFHDDICNTVACMANAYRKINIDKALRLFRIVLNAKSNVSEEIQCPADILKIYEDMLAVAKSKLETTPKNEVLQVEIAVLYFRMGSLYERLERLTDAANSCIKALRIQKIKRNYHDVGDLLNSLGIIHAKRRSYKRAMKCFVDSLKVRRTVMGEHHEDVGETLHNMGNCAAKQMDYDKALESYEKSLIIKRLTFGECSIASANTLQNIGYVNEELGLLDHSLNYYKDALAVRSMLLGEHHVDVAFSLHSIGLIYKKTERYAKAADCLKRSLILKTKHYIGGHHSVADTMNHLAQVYTELKRFKEATPLFEKALSIFEKKFGAHMTTAETLDSLGKVEFFQGNLEGSYSYLERSLALRRLIQGNDDIETINTLCLLGKVQSKSGDLDDALATFKEVLRVRKILFGTDTVEVAAIINDVGVIQLRLGRPEIAQNCFVEAEKVWRLTPDECQEYLGETLVNLGEIHHMDQKYDDAIRYFSEAMSIFELIHDDVHECVALVLYKLGKAQKEMHDFDNAMVSFERSLGIRTDLGDDSSMTVAEVLKDIGSLSLLSGDLTTARNCLGDALKIMKIKSPKSLITSDVLHELGKVMTKMKYKDEAFEAFNSALRIKRSRLEEDDVGVADLLSEIGSIFEEGRKWAPSLNNYRQALKIRESLLGEHELVADSYFSIGTVLQTVQKYHDALSSYGSALVKYQKLLGEDHLTCAKTMNNIGIVYEAIDELDEALKYHTEALRIRKKHLGADNIKVANSLDNIAGIYQRQNESNKALQSLKESLKIRSRFGNDNLDVATTLFGMGIIYCDKKDLGKAMECYEAALEIRKRRKGPHDVDVAKTLHNIGSLFALKQDYERALHRWQEALHIYRETLDDDHHMIACTLGNIKMAENMLEENDSS